MAISLALIIILGLGADYLFRRLKMPGLVGMLLGGHPGGALCPRPAAPGNDRGLGGFPQNRPHRHPAPGRLHPAPGDPEPHRPPCPAHELRPRLLRDRRRESGGRVPVEFPCSAAMLGPLIVALVLYLNGGYRAGFAYLLIPAILAVLVITIAAAFIPIPSIWK